MKINFQLAFFLLALFLIKLPPFYILPLQSRLYTTHTVAKLIIFFEFFFLLLISYKNDILAILKNSTFLLVTIYFISQSISIIHAKDIVFFLKYYQTTISVYLIFLLAFHLINNSSERIKKIFDFVIITGLICLFFEFIYIIFNNQITNLFNVFLQEEVLATYFFNINRGRFYLYITYELFLPFFLYKIYQNIKLSHIKNTFIYFVVSIFLIFLSVFSNFRRPILLNIFSIIFYLYFIFKRSTKKIKKIYSTFVIVSIMTIFVTISISNSLFSFNVVDRFVLSDKLEDVGSLNFRVDSFKNAIDMFKSEPIFGVGLGNYKYYVGKPIETYYYSSNNQKIVISDVNPHSIISRTIAETGLFGIFSLIIMLLYFIKRDLLYFSTHKIGILYPFIISFWTMFVFALFSPFDTVFLNGWFWFLRGIIEKFYLSKLKNKEVGVPKSSNKSNL